MILLWSCERFFKVVDFNVSQWVSLTVGYLTYFGTIILAFVTVSQNSVISDLTKKQYDLQKLSLTADRRPLLSITDFYLSQQNSENGIFVGSYIPLTEESFENPDSISKKKHYYSEVDYSLFDFFNNCDYPGQIRFQVGVTNRSNAIIHNLSYNTVFPYFDNKNRNAVLPVKRVLDIVEPGVSLSMNGVAIAKSNDFESCSYSFDITFSNDYNRVFSDTIYVFFGHNANTKKLRIIVQHEMKDKQYRTHIEPLEDHEMYMNGILDLKTTNYKDFIDHIH